MVTVYFRFPSTKILSELVSVQLFGIEDLATKLNNTPIEITLNLPLLVQIGGLNTLTQTACVFWNQSERCEHPTVVLACITVLNNDPSSLI